MFSAVGTAALVFLTAYLFYDTWAAGIILLPLGLLVYRLWLREIIKKKEIEFRGQFLDAVQMMISAMKAGYSVENALRETKADLLPLYGEKSAIHREFAKMIYQLDMNLTAEQVLFEFADRVNQEDIHNFVIVFSTAKRTGGDSIMILKDTAKIIGGRIETEREIQTIISAKRMEFRIMSAIPLGMVFYIRLAFSEFVSVLYGNPAGIVLMSICLGVYVFALYAGRKIIQISV